MHGPILTRHWLIALELGTCKVQLGQRICFESKGFFKARRALFIVQGTCMLVQIIKINTKRVPMGLGPTNVLCMHFE